MRIHSSRFIYARRPNSRLVILVRDARRIANCPASLSVKPPLARVPNKSMITLFVRLTEPYAPAGSKLPLPHNALIAEKLIESKCKFNELFSNVDIYIYTANRRGRSARRRDATARTRYASTDIFTGS